MASKVKQSRFVCLFSICLLAAPLSADIVLQGQNCGSQQTPLVVRMTQKDEDTVVSHVGEYYELSKDCIVTIIGKPYYQFQLELLSIDIDSRSYYADYCKGLCCNDYLKMFNSYRVDNARLFPVIGWKGLCGTQIPQRNTYTTSHNFVTIQFRTDEYDESMRGFMIRIRQFVRRNDGNINPEGGYIGGWNDGTYSELQLDWSEQEQIPGDLIPGGGDNDYDHEKGGIQCYECFGCRIDYFDPKSSTDRASVRNNCYVCSKEYQDGIARANRRCYTRLQYTSLLLTLTDTSTGSGDVSDFRGCRKFMNVQGIFINYCLCDVGNLCNKAGKLPFSLMLMTVSVLVSLILRLF
ncbi:uncharacterized protein LOC143286551 [Babylonia areolata]|uniref:uncharacterized protein LOC143286551 n=1 Tax=Babylonia areolata TaxID=304850 RepID=UPI003FD30384